MLCSNIPMRNRHAVVPPTAVKTWAVMTAGTQIPQRPPYVSGKSRPPYAYSGEARPFLRGAAYGWLHRTRAWYVLATSYVAASTFMLLSHVTDTRLSIVLVSLRLLQAATTSLNVWLSDGFHNSDKYGPEALSAASEIRWLKGDFFGISTVLTSSLWLWSANIGWASGLPEAGLASGVATFLVAVISTTLVPRRDGCLAVQALMAVQFLGLMGFLVWTILSSPALFTAFGINVFIYGIYAPGFALYVLRRPKRDDFGYHEYFHAFVITGHVASMVLDLRNLLLSTF